MRLILASSSPRRQALLNRLGLPYAIIKPAIDESALAGEAPVDYAERLSQEKAAAAAQMLDGGAALILAADTIVIDHEGGLLGKPADENEARRMLRRLRGRAHCVVTAITARQNAEPRRVVTRHARTIVHMRDFSDAEIKAYIASGDPFDKAGGYAIQNQLFQPVDSIDGSYSNVVGLPLPLVKTLLAELGYP